MTEIAVEMDHVCKKFKKGELYTKLREAIPALTKNLFRKIVDRSLGLQEFWALEDVSFQVKKGESLGIIGYNGAGKSTILKHLSGILKPTSGSVHVDGRLSALIEVGAGFHGDLTGRENIFLNGTILGMKKKEIESKFDDIVEFSGLEDFIDTPVKRYSSGMYTRLGFSVAAHLDPDILVIDEVLSVGDFVFQRKGLEKMKAILNSGATVIFVSHNMKAIADFCQRTILLDHGKIVKDGPTNEIIRYYLGQDASSRKDITEKEVFISKVSVRDENGENVQFESGQKALVDIEVFARTNHNKFAIVLRLIDDEFYRVFETSTEQLGYGSFSMNKGETLKCSFELTLHLAPAAYSLEIALYRYDIQQAIDIHSPAATIFLEYDKNILGIANLYPKVLSFETI